MAELVTADDVDATEVFSRWTGFASPPCRTAKLVIRRIGADFHRQTGDATRPDVVDPQLVADLLAALSHAPVSELDAALFDLPASVIASHFDGVWTDDHPHLLLYVRFRSGRVVAIRSEAQHAFMLPLSISRGDGAPAAETFDPRVSRAVAGLMPDRFLGRDRLAGECGMLEYALDEYYGRIRDDDDDSAGTSSSALGVDPRAHPLFLKHTSLDEVRQLLAEGVSPSVADDVGQTALMHAAFPPPDLERFRVLAAAGADVEARRHDGATGLHLACAGGMADSARAWVETGADVNARVIPDGETPLMLAVHWPEIVTMLLATGADVNARDANGDAALAHLVSNDDSWLAGAVRIRIAQALLDAGADANATNVRGESPVALAERGLARLRTEHDVETAFGIADRFELKTFIANGREGWPAEEAAAAALVELLRDHASRQRRRSDQP